MKSIKPGRGPSMMSGIGSIGAAVFGVIWMIAAISMGAPWFFALFGIFFIGMAIMQAVYNLKNATSKNRFSSFDITEANEEGDPLDRIYGKNAGQSKKEDEVSPELERNRFCPFCGSALEENFVYCNQCGKQLP